MNTTTQTREDKMRAFFSELHIDNLEINDYLSSQDYEDMAGYDDLYEVLNNSGAFDVEIIYYSNAIEYLKENDSSLHVSMEIASEYGYTPENLNSEILASLLASQLVMERFSELQDEIDDFFLELETS